MAETVYALCALLSIFCALLLLRGYLRTHTRLLLWSALCFAGLGLNNLILFVDLVVVPDIDLAIPRTVVALAAVSTLLVGLVWESR